MLIKLYKLIKKIKFIKSTIEYGQIHQQLKSTWRFAIFSVLETGRKSTDFERLAIIYDEQACENCSTKIVGRDEDEGEEAAECQRQSRLEH